MTANNSFEQLLEKLPPEAREFLQSQRGQIKSTNIAALTARETSGDVPLSFSQEWMWAFDQLMADRSIYNSARIHRIHGDIDVGALELALQTIVRRHEALRSVIFQSEGVYFQYFQENWQLKIQQIDLHDSGTTNAFAQALELVEREAKTLFDLQKDLLLRARLYRLGDRDHIFQVTSHHIVSDHWSRGIFHRELAELYAAEINLRKPNLCELPVQYGDFAIWQHQRQQKECALKEKDYWKQQLKSAPYVELPADRPRSAKPLMAGSKLTFEINAETVEGLRQFAKRERATLYTVLMAGLQTLIYRYTGEQDFVIGSPVAGRRQPELRNLLGCFINTLAFRADLDGQPSFRELVCRVRDCVSAALQYQEYPFNQVLVELGIPRLFGQSPLFQVLFVMHSNPYEELRLESLTVEPLDLNAGNTKFDATLIVAERQSELHCTLEFSTELYDEDRMQRMAGHFANILSNASENPALSVAQIPIMSSDETAMILDLSCPHMKLS